MPQTFDVVLAQFIESAFVHLDADGAPLFRWKDQLVPTHEYLNQLLGFEPALMLLLEERVSQILQLGRRSVKALNAQRRALGVPTTSHMPVRLGQLDADGDPIYPPPSPSTPEAPVVRTKVGSRFLVRPGEHHLSEPELLARQAKYQVTIVGRTATATLLQCQRCGTKWTVDFPVYQLPDRVRYWECRETKCRRAARQARRVG